MAAAYREKQQSLQNKVNSKLECCNIFKFKKNCAVQKNLLTTFAAASTQKLVNNCDIFFSDFFVKHRVLSICTHRTCSMQHLLHGIKHARTPRRHCNLVSSRTLLISSKPVARQRLLTAEITSFFMKFLFANNFLFAAKSWCIFFNFRIFIVFDRNFCIFVIFIAAFLCEIFILAKCKIRNWHHAHLF